MSNPYTDYKQAFPSNSGGGLYVKLEPDTTTKVRILSDAYWSESEYTDNETGETTKSDRYSWVVWNYETESAQVLSKGVSIFNRVVELAEDEDWGDPTSYDIKITRTGTMLETRYTIIPGKQSEITDEQSDAGATVDIEKAVPGALPIGRRVSGQAGEGSKVFN